MFISWISNTAFITFKDIYLEVKSQNAKGSESEEELKSLLIESETEWKSCLETEHWNLFTIDGHGSNLHIHQQINR